MPRLFQLLRTFSTRSLGELQKYMDSPAFNQREDLQRLVEAYRSWPAGKAIAEETMWERVYSRKPFLRRDWRLLLSRCLKQVEYFLVLNQLKEEEVLWQLLLARAQRRLQLTPFFERAIRAGQKILKKRAQYDSGSLQLKYQLEDIYYDYVASHKRQERTNLQEVSDDFDHYFIATKLKQACLAHSRFITNQEEYRIGLLEAVLGEIRQRPPLLNVPAIAVYYQCYQAVVEGGDESDFQALRSVMEQYQGGFPNAEMRDIYLLAINYCIRRANTGEQAFIAEALELYRQSLDKGYLLQDGVMPESTFSNIISLAIRLGKFDWSEKFIEDYHHKLPPNFRTPLFLLNMGKLRYAQQRPSAALKQLAQVETRAPFLYLGAKVIQAKIFYETKEWEPLESLLASMRTYLQRNKKLGYRQVHYQHFIRFARRLLQLAPYDTKVRQSLVRDIKSEKLFQEKEWFLEQLKGRDNGNTMPNRPPGS
jgi:hypothetical protein